MVHLKGFKDVYEQLEISNEGTITSTYTPSVNPMGDYDITWESAESGPVTASFKEITKQIEKEGKEGFTYFESLPKSSSDGMEYAAEAELANIGDGSFQIVKFTIMPK